MNDGEYQLINYNGWRFCPTCRNLLKPYKPGEKLEILLFKCSSQKCSDQKVIEVKIDLNQTESALLMRKDYQAAKAIDITDSILVLDPSMPRKKVICPKCQHDIAVYFFKTDSDEKNITIQYICANRNPFCGKTWTQQEMNEPLLSLN